MRQTAIRWFTRAVAVAAVVVGVGIADSSPSGLGGNALAASATPTSPSSSSTPPKTVWKSKSTQPHTSGALWDRSAPATPPAAASSGGYTKPGAGAGAPSAKAVPPTAAPQTSGGYSKPGTSTVTAAGVTAPNAAAPPTSPPPGSSVVSSGGYSKPALGLGLAAGVGAAANSASTSAAPASAPVASSGGYTKPSLGTNANTATPGNAAPSTPAPASAPVASSGGYTKPSLSAGLGAAAGAAAAASTAAPSPPPATSSANTPSPSVTAAAKPPAGGFDRGANRQLANQSLARYKAEQDRFTAPPQGTLTNASTYAHNPLYAHNAGRYANYDQAYAARDTYRNNNPWTPPAYAYRSAPSFGMWDALFWWMVLDKITEPSHAAAAYNNANDPGFQAWRREADRQAADNAELKAKLNAMDAKLATMQGQPRVPGTLPQGVPAAVALAPEVAVAPHEVATLVMGTGSPSGHYYPFCQGGDGVHGLREHLQGLTLDCRVTNGSAENLDGLVDGSFDAVMIQSDIFGDWLSKHPGVHLDALKATIYQEYVQVLANKQAKIKRISDLDASRHLIYLVGSGAQATWDGFAAVDPSYAAFDTAGRVRRVPNDPAVLNAVAANPDAVMMFVSGLKSDLLRRANDQFGDALTMVLVDDSRFASVLDATGHPVYAYAKIPSGLYPKLQRSRWFGLTSSVPSLTVGAVFILSEQWVSENGVANLSKVEDALWHTIPEIEHKVGTGS